jgi:hypothetical protein
MNNKNGFKAILFISLLFQILNSCDSGNKTVSDALTENDKEGLLYMLEEEQLARDTYTYLDSLWANMPFANIKGSEQTHMDAIKSLLDANNVSYTILPAGQFTELKLQEYYNQFIKNGSLSLTNALKIGATIEDLDIVDLKEYIDSTTNQSVIDVFNNLECGSRNHLRSFNNSIAGQNETYTPQFLSIEEFNSIINSDKEKCNFK